MLHDAKQRIRFFKTAGGVERYRASAERARSQREEWGTDYSTTSPFGLHYNEGKFAHSLPFLRPSISSI
jgi:hypothetical protein